jgi:hypothetical protein
LGETGSTKENAMEKLPALPEPKESLVRSDARVLLRWINKAVFVIARHSLSSPVKGVNLARASRRIPVHLKSDRC